VKLDIDERSISIAAEESIRIIRKQFAIEKELIRAGIIYSNL